MENRNAIIKLVTIVANGYRNWDRFRNRCMLVLEKGIDDFENDKDDGSVKMVKKKGPGQLNKMLSESNISYKPFLGICLPLNSCRANSPNPIQIYCANPFNH